MQRYRPPRIRRKTHNQGLRRVVAVFLLAATAGFGLGIWAMVHPWMRQDGILLLVLAALYFTIGMGLGDRRPWALSASYLLLVAQLFVLPSLTTPQWWIGLIPGLIMLPMLAYLLRETVRRRFNSKNAAHRLPVNRRGAGHSAGHSVRKKNAGKSGQSNNKRNSW